MVLLPMGFGGGVWRAEYAIEIHVFAKLDLLIPLLPTFLKNNARTYLDFPQISAPLPIMHC